MKQFVAVVIFLCYVHISFAQTEKKTVLYPSFDSNGFYGYKNQSGEYKITSRFLLAWPYSEGIARVLVSTKAADSIAYINTYGHFLFHRKFVSGKDFSEGYALVKTDSQWVFISSAGVLEDHVRFNDASSFHEGFARVYIKGKWGLIDNEFKFVHPPIYDFIGWPDEYSQKSSIDSLKFYQGTIPFLSGSKWGVLNVKGKKVRDADLDYISYFSENLARAKQGDSWYFIKSDYSSLGKNAYVSIHDFKDGMAAVKATNASNQTYGFINSKGKEVIHPEYKRVFYSFNKGLAIVGKDVVDENNNVSLLCGVIDKKNKAVLPFRFTEAGEIINGVIPVKNLDDQWELYNISGKFIGKDRYDDYAFLTENLIKVKKDGRWGVINTVGKEIISGNYKEISVSGDKKLILKSLDQWTISNLRNSVNVDADFVEILPSGDYLLSFNEERKIVDSEGQTREISVAENISGEAASKIDAEDFEVFVKNKKKGVRKNGNILIASDYENITYSVTDSIFLANDKDVFTIFDLSGQERSSFVLDADKVFPYSNGFARYMDDGHIGFINFNGKIVISPQYEAAHDFSEGLAAVKLMKKWGFVNKEEELIIQPYYQAVSPFQNGAALIFLDGKYNFINEQGVVLNSAFYDEAIRTDYNNWLLRSGNKWGLANSKGREVIAPKYESLFDCGEERVVVAKDGQKGIVNFSQDFVLDLKFETILFNSPKNEFLLMKKGSEEKIEINKLLN